MQTSTCDHCGVSDEETPLYGSDFTGVFCADCAEALHDEEDELTY